MGEDTKSDAPDPAGLGGLMADLKTELEAQAKAKEEAGTTEPTMAKSDAATDFALILFFGLVISSVGIAFIRYGKNTAQPVMAIAGLVLLVIPFAIKNVVLLLLAGLAIALAPFLLRRLGVL